MVCISATIADSGRLLAMSGMRTILPGNARVLSGALAALSVKHVVRRWSGFGEFARKAPYFSGALILLVGLYLGYQGLQGLA